MVREGEMVEERLETEDPRYFHWQVLLIHFLVVN